MEAALAVGTTLAIYKFVVELGRAMPCPACKSKGGYEWQLTSLMMGGVVVSHFHHGSSMWIQCPTCEGQRWLGVGFSQKRANGWWLG